MCERTVNQNLVEALTVLIDHAEEKYPHFESERGVRDIEQARAALARADAEEKEHV